jgi:hypothetical protein
MKPVRYHLLIPLLIAALSWSGIAAAADTASARDAGDQAPYWPAARRDPADKPARPTSSEPRGPMWTIASDDEDTASRPRPAVRHKTASCKTARTCSKTSQTGARQLAAKSVPKAKTPVKLTTIQTPPPRKTALPDVKSALVPVRQLAAPLPATKPATAKPPAPVVAKTPAPPRPAPASASASAAASSGAAMADQIILADATKACTAKDANACLILGRMYATGTVAAKNEAAAVISYKRSCDLGSSSACHALGAMHEKGAGVSVSITQAAYYYQLACEAGNTAACKSAKRVSVKSVAAKFRLPELFPTKKPVS